MFLAQMPTTPQLPPLPEGPSLDRVRGPIEIPAYEPWQIALAVVFSLIFLAGLAWLILRILKKPAASTSPYEAAVAELNTAAALTEDDNRFAVLTSQALRRYFEDGLGLRFSARTSEEFLQSLKGTNKTPQSVAERGTRFDRTAKTEPQPESASVFIPLRRDKSRIRYNTESESSQDSIKFDEAFQNELGELLAAFDRIKFARQSIRKDERTKITDTARRLIDQAHASAQQEGGSQ